MRAYVNKLVLESETADVLAAKNAADAARQKYDAAKKKDADTYGQYVRGEITAEQYMNGFAQMLDVEREFRIAQKKQQMTTARGRQTAQSASTNNAQQEPLAP